MSMKIFYGDDRVKAEAEIRKILGKEYEVMEGVNLTSEMMPSIFEGVSLFAEKRKIVVKDLGENKICWDKLVDFVGTEHEVIVWEGKLDKRTATYKTLTKAGVEAREFKLPERTDFRKVFDIYNTALTDGKRAVKMLEEVQAAEDPYAFVGLLTSQALKGFAGRPREKKIVKALAELDLMMKNSTVEPWSLVKSLLLRLEKI